MKVLFVIYALSGGGAERVISAVSSALAQRAHEVILVTLGSPPRSFGSSPRDFYPLHSEVSRYCLGRAEAEGHFASVPKNLVAIRSLLKRQIDAAVGFMPSAYVPLGLAAVGTGVPVIASEHTAFDHYGSRPVQALLLRASTPLFAAITSTSERVRAGYPPSIARRMVVIPNPVTVGGRSGVEATASARKVVLCVGWLREEKGHATVIAAFSRVAGAFPDWDLRIVGEGALRGRLEEQVRDLGLERRVVFAGAVADTAEEYAAADLFVVPSRYEAFGLATAEALSAGLPAVGFADCPGTNELIRDGFNGLLVAGPDRAAALADGLSRLMNSAETRLAMGDVAPASVAGYDLDEVVGRWEALLASVAAGKERLEK